MNQIIEKKIIEKKKKIIEIEPNKIKKFKNENNFHRSSFLPPIKNLIKKFLILKFPNQTEFFPGKINLTRNSYFSKINKTEIQIHGKNEFFFFEQINIKIKKVYHHQELLMKNSLIKNVLKF
jgi:hypothetical protein